VSVDFFAAQPKKTAAATTTAFYIFVGVLLQRTKSIQDHKGGRTTTTKKLTRERGAGFSPFGGLDQTHMLCYATHIWTMELGRDEKSGAGLYRYPCAASLPAIYEGVMETQERHVHIVQPKETFLAIQSPSRGAQSFLSIESKVVHLKWRGENKK
jgi:hypothetical protein